MTDEAEKIFWSSRAAHKFKMQALERVRGESIDTSANESQPALQEVKDEDASIDDAKMLIAT